MNRISEFRKQSILQLLGAFEIAKHSGIERVTVDDLIQIIGKDAPKHSTIYNILNEFKIGKQSLGMDVEAGYEAMKSLTTEFSRYERYIAFDNKGSTILFENPVAAGLFAQKNTGYKLKPVETFYSCTEAETHLKEKE